MNKPSQFWSWLNRRAYAVYIIHPPVLVGISLLLHPWIAPALVKFAVTGTLTCVASGWSLIRWCASRQCAELCSAIWKISADRAANDTSIPYNLPETARHLTSEEDSYGNEEGNQKEIQQHFA